MSARHASRLLVAFTGLLLLAACGKGGTSVPPAPSAPFGLPAAGAQSDSRALTYSVPCYTAQGGASIVAASGCTITVQSGGALTLDSGSTVTGAVANDLNGSPLVLDPGGTSKIQATADYAPILTLGGTPTAASLKVNNSAATPVAVFGGNGSGGIWQAVGLAQNVGMLPSITSSAVTAATNGALWTVPASQTWKINRVFCNITTNFDCTGDDCALIIGDGNDTDGFLVLADAELQTADTEGTGFAAGWQGLVAATVGAYLDPEQTFIYAATDTIDIDIRDVSAGTDPTAGAGTCYLDYTRLN